MNRLETVCTAVALFVLLAFSSSGFAAKGGTPGPPTGDGGGGGGSGGAPDLGDLIVLYRDAWGLPILTDVVNNEGLCQQPLAAPGERFLINGTQCTPALMTDSCIIPVDPATCAVVVGYETYTQEVDFGRTSVIRSPVSVIEQSLGEVITKLATAQCTTLDPAGRLVNTSKIDGEVFSATIDSPLENLAIYRQLMLTGYLGADATAIVLPDENVLNMAARGLGAAADKTGKVTVDQVVYSNEIMGLTDENVQTYLPKICMNVREEVQGTVQQVRKCFLDYSAYGYNRATNFGELPAPAYIPKITPNAGWFEYLGLWSDAGGAYPDLFYIVQGPILDSVFCLNNLGEPVVPKDGICTSANHIDLGFLDGNIGGFTQAADDTREVILFTHDRPLPFGYETAVPICDVPDIDVVYDLSISEQSGLQVPKQIVDGSEGREFTVAVANAGPDTASGTVRVTAVAANGVPIEGSPWTFTFTDLAGGSSKSWVTFFSIELGARTTIAWTAEAIPDCENCDLNLGNNTVTATSSVRVTGSGGR
ncbi:hypothetical protein FCL47_14095 [Desulfopila sp. IMCC35006]|uniref:hypothetical protein n=1 Tax=Desulfopila sp. IMCC35006 TaxID=2569542 RepID=UPI0010ACA1BA|nr:hypothetical protein [Desulfopila sp. IMCC35006]TKB25653.1 hypothetical protein FCL47_14095 [Desulfopila sp. IMCC35006]